jgi:hypothetical protein
MAGIEHARARVLRVPCIVARNYTARGNTVSPPSALAAEREGVRRGRGLNSVFHGFPFLRGAPRALYC